MILSPPPLEKIQTRSQFANDIGTRADVIVNKNGTKIALTRRICSAGRSFRRPSAFCRPSLRRRRRTCFTAIGDNGDRVVELGETVRAPDLKCAGTTRTGTVGERYCRRAVCRLAEKNSRFSRGFTGRRAGRPSRERNTSGCGRRQSTTNGRANKQQHGTIKPRLHGRSAWSFPTVICSLQIYW